MLSTADILKLAEAYSKATGLTLRGAGERACGENNGKAFIRLAEGKGINTKTAEVAEQFFRHNWPANARWPRSVAGGPVTRVPKFTARAGGPGPRKATPTGSAPGSRPATA